MLTVFDFIIEHYPGVSNPTDMPSQRPDYKPKEGDVLEDILFPILQEKLSYGLVKSEGWIEIFLEFKPLTISMMMHSKAAQLKEENIDKEPDTCSGD